jgi:hypothetical protein
VFDFAMKQSISKKQIALVQLRRAIQLYSQRDFVCALTLAGAAEEILGRIALNAAGTNAMDQEVSFVAEVVDFAKTHGIDAKARPPQDLIQRRNFARNEAKHEDGGNPSRLVSFDFHVAAEEMIDRALRNWSLAFGGDPEDRVITRYMRLHYDA